METADWRTVKAEVGLQGTPAGDHCLQPSSEQGLSLSLGRGSCSLSPHKQLAPSEGERGKCHIAYNLASKEILRRGEPWGVGVEATGSSGHCHGVRPPPGGPTTEFSISRASPGHERCQTWREPHARAGPSTPTPPSPSSKTQKSVASFFFIIIPGRTQFV